MQCSFGTSPGGNDEAICLIDSVESHVPKEDDTRKVDIRIVRASNASKPSFQIGQEQAGSPITQPIFGHRERFLSRRCLFSRVIEDILL